jgi:hypothetical protein
MKRLDINNGRSILFPAINIDRAGLAQRDSNNTRRRICTKEDRVFLELHESSTDCADLQGLKARLEIVGGLITCPDHDGNRSGCPTTAYG